MTLPSMGDNRSRTGPWPRHSPQHTPGLTALIPNLSSQWCIQHLLLREFHSSRTVSSHAPALFAQHFHNLRDGARGKVQRRTKTNRLLARTNRQQADLEESQIKF